MNEFFRRLRYLLSRRRFDRELAGDLEFHREMAAREGRHLGNTLRLRDEARDARGLDVDRPFLPGPSLHSSHLAQIARLYSRGGPDACYRYRRQRGSVQLFRFDGLEAAECP